MDDAIPVDGHVVPDRHVAAMKFAPLDQDRRRDPHQRWGERPAFGCDGPLLDYAQPNNVLRCKPVERPASNKSVAGSAERCAPEKSLKAARDSSSKTEAGPTGQASSCTIPSHGGSIPLASNPIERKSRSHVRR